MELLSLAPNQECSPCNPMCSPQLPRDVGLAVARSQYNNMGIKQRKLFLRIFSLSPHHPSQQQCYSPFLSEHAGPARPCPCSQWPLPCERCTPGTRASWLGSRLKSESQSPGAGGSDVLDLQRAAPHCASVHYQADRPPPFNQRAQFADAHPPIQAR